MELIALCASGAYPLGDMGTSCYLVKSDVNLVFDFGVTALSRIEKFCSLNDVNGIFLSHFHVDHISDIFALKYHEHFKSGKKMKVYVVDEDCDEKRMIQKIDCFELIDIKAGDILQIGHTKVEIVESSHVGKTVGFVITHNGKSIYYTSDTRLTKTVFEHAKDVDILLCDCFKDSATFLPTMPHMSAEDVNKLAKKCAGKTLATHLYPTARRAIGEQLQDVEIIQEQKIYTV